jgi:hypothetical protein
MKEIESQCESANRTSDKLFQKKLLEDNFNNLIIALIENNKSNSKLSKVLIWVTIIYTFVTAIGVIINLFK